MTPQQRAQPAAPTRFLLADVPRVGFYQGGERCPEDIPFPSCLRACLDYFGEGFGHRLISSYNTIWRLDDTFTCLMGVTGYAFSLSWWCGWQQNGAGTDMTGDPSAPFRRAFEAAGYELIPVDPGGRHDDEQYYRGTILRSLRQGRPVIAFGVIGPPEACLVTGYDENGDVLTGWNFFQDFPEYNSGVAFEASGEFRKRDWFANTHNPLLFGEKQPAPPKGKMYRKALHWAIQLMRPLASAGRGHDGGSANGDIMTGAAAYPAWASALLHDEDFPENMAVLRERFHRHDEAVGKVAEGRWYAARFMELAASVEPGLEEELMAAAACFESEHELMWKAWGVVGGNGHSEENIRKLGSPAARREIAPLILQAGEKDREAANWIARALQK